MNTYNSKRTNNGQIISFSHTIRVSSVMVLLLFSISCQKDDAIKKEPIVYISGYKGNTSDFINYATIWENGKATPLPDSYMGNGRGLFVSGSDIYVAGTAKTELNNTVAKYWKNGAVVNLTSGNTNAYANAIFVSGSDVYVAGEDDGHAQYWKNGTVVKLSVPEDSRYSTLYAIYVSGTDVYVAGTVSNSSGQQFCVYWKNGVGVTLSNGNQYAMATGITVVGSDVYVSGYEISGEGAYSAKYWKNGLVYPLGKVGNGATANGIFVEGSDVYVPGRETQLQNGNNVYVAVYWKNGTAVNLLDGSELRGIWVSDNDVHAVGAGTDGRVVKYWKNGIATNLTPEDDVNYGKASAIFIVQ